MNLARSRTAPTTWRLASELFKHSERHLLFGDVLPQGVDRRIVFDKFRRTPEFERSDGESPLHPPDQCVLKETGKPESIGRAPLRALLFRAGSSPAENDTSDGGPRNGPSLDGYRVDRRGA